MQSTLKVKGTGRMQLPPDEIQLTLELVTNNPEYAIAMEEATRRLHVLEQSLRSMGFSEESIQTTSFSVDTKYVYDNNVHRFDGYEVRQKLSLALDMDTKRLGETLQAIARVEVDPQMQVHFRLKDTVRHRKELLKRAADDAREIAETLAEATGAALGTLLEVRTDGWNPTFVSPMTYKSNRVQLAESSPAMDFRPADVHEEAEVFFIWELLEG